MKLKKQNILKNSNKIFFFESSCDKKEETPEKSNLMFILEQILKLGILRSIWIRMIVFN